MMLTEKTFNTGSITINYAEGKSKGAPFVLLHGITGRWQDLAPLINALEHRWHVYACDLRGHGKSSHAQSYRAIDSFPDTVEFIKRNIGVSAVLLGHSGGAIAALGVATQIPELIQTLILLDPPIFLREVSIKTDPIYNYFLGVYNVLTHQQTVREVFPELFPHIDEAGLHYFEDMVDQVDPACVQTILDDRYFEGLDIQALLEQVTCPTLLLYGEIERGSVVRDRDVEFFLNSIPHGAAIQLKGSGHLPHEEQPARVLELVRQWTEKLP